MSIKAVTWAFEQRLDDPTAKLVLLGIADKYNEDRGYAWPSIARLSEMADCTERTVTRKISMLAELGYVQILHNPPQTNRYFLPTMTECHPDTRCHGNPDTPDGVTLTPDVLLTIDNDINNNNMIKSSFEEFWNEVPKKVGKKAAYRAYKTAYKEVGAEKLHNQISAYSQTIRKNGTEQQFILHPTTWLSQGRWDDEELTNSTGAQNFGVTKKWVPSSKEEFDSRVLGANFNFYKMNRPDVLRLASQKGWYNG